MCIIAEGRVEYSNASRNSATSRQSYMKNPTIGISIEGLNDGTLGMFMQREDDSIAALSCAHVLEDRGAGYTVTQPAVTDFRKSYQRLEMEWFVGSYLPTYRLKSSGLLLTLMVGFQILLRLRKR